MILGWQILPHGWPHIWTFRDCEVHRDNVYLFLVRNLKGSLGTLKSNHSYFSKLVFRINDILGTHCFVQLYTSTSRLINDKLKSTYPSSFSPLYIFFNTVVTINNESIYHFQINKTTFKALMIVYSWDWFVFCFTSTKCSMGLCSIVVAMLIGLDSPILEDWGSTMMSCVWCLNPNLWSSPCHIC